MVAPRNTRAPIPRSFAAQRRRWAQCGRPTCASPIMAAKWSSKRIRVPSGAGTTNAAASAVTSVARWIRETSGTGRRNPGDRNSVDGGGAELQRPRAPRRIHTRAPKVHTRGVLCGECGGRLGPRRRTIPGCRWRVLARHAYRRPTASRPSSSRFPRAPSARPRSSPPDNRRASSGCPCPCRSRPPCSRPRKSRAPCPSRC